MTQVSILLSYNDFVSHIILYSLRMLMNETKITESKWMASATNLTLFGSQKRDLEARFR